jgi:hypothetical protein
MPPWFDNQADALTAVRRNAEQIVLGEVDAYQGASDLWHTALLLKNKDFALLQPFADLTDEYEVGKPSAARTHELKAELVAAAKRLLADKAFWA